MAMRVYRANFCRVHGLVIFFHPKTKHEKSEKGKKHMEQVQFDLRTPRLRRNTFATMLLAFLLPESYVYVL
jgi:hypothetical protein